MTGLIEFGWSERFSPLTKLRIALTVASSRLALRWLTGTPRRERPATVRPGTTRGADDPSAIGDRLGERCVALRRSEHVSGVHRAYDRGGLASAPRSDQAQILQAEVLHRPCRCADVAEALRANQHDAHAIEAHGA